MRRWMSAGLIYFAVVFAIGFLLGAIRTLWLEPRLGELPSVLIELPVILGASWLVCARIIRVRRVPATRLARLVMGATAFILLMAAETLLSLIAFAIPPTEYLGSFRETARAIGLFGQLLFALFPLLQRRRS